VGCLPAVLLLAAGPLITVEPAVGYGLADATGDIGSTANGAFGGCLARTAWDFTSQAQPTLRPTPSAPCAAAGTAQFAYNPIGNNLGLSVASGINNAFNPLAVDGGRG
jgi:hypothetical protein